MIQAFHGIEINDLGDGGSKQDKFTRDIALLEEGLKDEPTNSRYMFYLAQSYRDTGNYDLAADWYEKRVKAGGWAEEQWHAQYQLGYCLEHTLDMHPEPAYLKAFSMRPTRAEPLFRLASIHLNAGSWDSAYMYANFAAEMPIPKDLLFVETSVYVWKALEVAAIAGFYIPRYFSAGYSASKKLVAMSQNGVTIGMTTSDISRIEQNHQWYKQKET